MAIGMYFRPEGMTKDTYDEVIRRLDDAGAGSPPGRTHHFALQMDDGSVHVFDVWDSQEQFDKFGETLVPILDDLGTNPGQPGVAQVHNYLAG
jgi:hypothetical protein